MLSCGISTPRTIALLCLLTGPACVQWADMDIDGDGVVAGLDCDDSDPGIHPNAAETWYDGIDQDCDGNDGDQDGDGYLSWQVDGPDCWDDPTLLAEENTVLGGSGWTQPVASEVHPEAPDTFYDGVDANCDGGDDFDADGDGYPSAFHPNRLGELGPDCIDGSPLDSPNPANLTPSEVNPEASDTCYDGTNADCDTQGADIFNENGGYDSDYDCDKDGWMASEECDDTNASIEPGQELDPFYDCIDANCDGNDGDQDGDGLVPDSYAATCDWTLFSAHRGTGDCWDDPALSANFQTLPPYLPLSPEEVFTGAEERFYDGVDGDCLGDSDFDLDQDGYDASDVTQADGSTGEDCADSEAAINPGQQELCATFEDDNCDGNTNDQDATDCQDFYEDLDKDGFGSAQLACHCEATGFYTATSDEDCDDGDESAYPGAQETCDGDDEDCDSEIDEDNAIDATTWYLDDDNDGYGRISSSVRSCEQPSDYVAKSGDCRPADPNAHPGADEYCDGHDDDCDSEIDEAEALDATDWYLDGDGDGYGNPGSSQHQCSPPTGHVSDDSDCDDSDASIHPLATDHYGDGIDADCDGLDCETDTLGSLRFAACGPANLNWFDALDACSARGDDLASLRSPSEDTLASDLLDILGATEGQTAWGWVGGSDFAVEGSWEWADGASFSYDNWQITAPGGGSSENCIDLLSTSAGGDWNDDDCLSGFSNVYYICQKR